MGVTPSHETSVQLDAIKKVTRIWSMTMHVAGMWSGQCASQLIPVHYTRTVLLNEGL